MSTLVHKVFNELDSFDTVTPKKVRRTRVYSKEVKQQYRDKLIYLWLYNPLVDFAVQLWITSYLDWMYKSVFEFDHRLKSSSYKKYRYTLYNRLWLDLRPKWIMYYYSPEVMYLFLTDRLFDFLKASKDLYPATNDYTKRENSNVKFLKYPKRTKSERTSL